MGRMRGAASFRASAPEWRNRERVGKPRAHRKLVLRAKAARDRTVARVAYKTVIAGVDGRGPLLRPLVSEGAESAGRRHAAPGPEGRDPPVERRLERRDAEERAGERG